MMHLMCDYKATASRYHHHFLQGECNILLLNQFI